MSHGLGDNCLRCGMIFFDRGFLLKPRGRTLTCGNFGHLVIYWLETVILLAIHTVFSSSNEDTRKFLFCPIENGNLGQDRASCQQLMRVSGL